MAKQKILARATSPLDWPQVYICPEGENSDGKSLKHFRAGAFLAGVPVQAVSLDHSSHQSTWAWHQGYGYILSILPVLASLYTTITLQYLPVYIPGEVERRNPDIYRENVRRYIANQLAIKIAEI